MPSAEHRAAAFAPFQGNDRLILGMVLGVLTFWLFAQSTVNIVPAIQQDVAIPLPSLNLAISLTALLSGCFIVAAGGAADRLGRVRITYLGFMLSIVGCLCLLFARSTPLFVTGRIIQGLSAACIMPATLALVKAYYLGAARQRALSFWSVGSWGGSGICSLAGGAVATFAGWKWIFILSILCALLGMWLIRGTPESKTTETQHQRFDYAGLIAFIITLIALNLLITKGRSLGWSSVGALALAGISALGAVAFFINAAAKKTAGFIDLSLFKNRPYRAAVLSNFLLNTVVGTLLVASLYVQEARGFSAFQSGTLTIGYLVAVLAMIRVGEKLLQKAGARKPMLLGTGMTACGVALISLTFLPGTTYVAAVVVGYVLFGLGLGFYATPSIDTAIASTAEEKIGVASGIYKMASSLGGAFGIAISASVYAALLPLGASVAASAGLWVNVTFCLLSMSVVAVMLPKDAGCPKGIKSRA